MSRASPKHPVLPSQSYMPQIDDNYNGQSTWVLLFSCLREECAPKPQSWRAFRLNHDQPNLSLRKATASPESPAQDVPIQAELSGANNCWGFEAQRSDMKLQASDALDFSDLTAALDAMQPAQAGGGAARGGQLDTDSAVDLENNFERMQPSRECQSPTQQPVLSTASVSKGSPSPSVLPCFYLTIEEETSRAQDDVRGRDVTHAHQLSHRLASSNGAQTSVGEPSSKPGGNWNGVVVEDGGSSDGLGESWEGEGYEEDAVLVASGRRGVDRHFLKFMKRLQMSPEQCVRFPIDTNDRLLWPGENLPQPAQCRACGSERRFLLQLMTPTIAALEESADWLEVGNGSILCAPPSWDWATVAIFACSQRCSGIENGDDSVWIEEEVAVAVEE
jgi:hypothetical protein